MTLDPELLKEAHDAGLAFVAILESEAPTQDQIRSAFWWSQKATGGVERGSVPVYGAVEEG